MESLPRSTRTQGGQLNGAALTARQVRAIHVQIEQVAPGVMQLSCPGFGWRSQLARNPVQLAQLVASAFTESQVAAYSHWRGRSYEGRPQNHDGVAPRRDYPIRRGHRTDTHDPRLWKVDADGRWVSPGAGRRFNPESQVVQRVQARLAALWSQPQHQEGQTA